MTHEYTLLIGGIVIPGGSRPDVTAIAWAADTVLALGSDDEVRAISRGDSHFVDLQGAFVIPLGTDGEAHWPTEATLDVGGPASLAILADDPRSPQAKLAGRPVALVHNGHVVAGALPRRTGVRGAGSP